MTKGQLIEAMRDLDDDAEVRVYCTSLDSDGGQYAHDIYSDDIVSGADARNEITIVAHY